jgi:hypothetical protein
MEWQMKKVVITVYAALLAFGFFAGHAAMADSDRYFPPDAMEQNNDTLFTAEELDELVAPIALYPDPLIAQILPAATFIDQIDLAARYVRQYGENAQIDVQPWDVSVKAVAHYPDVLYMMDQKYDWTLSLGQAFVNQPQDVMDAIQRMRAEAEAEGNLVSTPEQQVVDEGGVISIIPAAPDVIYVPQYDPLAVYVERPSPSYGFITFGIGFTIGAWLNRDCDWHGHRVYYHGWQGGGWIGRSRPHVQARNNVYVNNNYSVINTNRRVTQYDTGRQREEIRRDVQLHRERTGRTVPPARAEQAGPGSSGSRPPVRPDTTNVYRGSDIQKPKPVPQTGYGGYGRTVPPARVEQAGPASSGSRLPVRSDTRNVYRGRDIQKSQPVSQTGYGGYGTSKDATLYRERGRTSRGNMQQFTRPAPAQRPTPAQHPAVSGGKPAQRPAFQQAPRQAPAGAGRQQQR